MNYQSLFAPAVAKPVRVALVGVGEFGMSLISQARSVRGLNVVASLDLDADRARERIAGLGLSATVAETASAATAAANASEHVVTSQFETLLSLKPDLIVEATGHAEAAARHAARAIETGIGVVMVSKECECVVGPILAQKARQKGVAYTLVEGDQPALLISLVSRASVLGLPVIAAGKSSEYDYLFDPASGELTWLDQSVSAPQLADLWTLGEDVAGVVADRARAAGTLPLRTVPDYCEMVLAVNATGLLPDRPDFHAPLTRANELQEIYVPRVDGGVLSTAGRIDVFNNLRHPEEVSFAGGVFVVVEWPDRSTGQVFRGKGIPTSRDGRYGVMYNPSHLLGVEAPLSILAAARLDNQYTSGSYRPRVDLTARAATDLAAGTVLDIVGNRHAVPGLIPQLTPAQAIADDQPLPYYMAVGQRLRKNVAAGSQLWCGDIEASTDSTLWSLRREMDSAFRL